MTPKEYLNFVIIVGEALSKQKNFIMTEEDITSFNYSLYPNDIFSEEELREYNRLMKVYLIETA